MCGPFTRNLSNAPQALLDQIQQQQQALAKHQISVDQFDFAIDDESTPIEDVPFNLEQDFSKGDIQNLALPDVDESVLFNWSLLDQPFAEPAKEAPSAASTPEDFGFAQDFNFDFSLKSVKVEKVQSQPVIENKPPAEKKPVARTSGKSKSKPPKPPAAPKSESSGGEAEEGECKPYTEKLPKDLLDHPCAATLLSAGIRIKGRTREELLEVAERIKKRRRASAARCRARKATHVHHLEDENKELKQENIMLKQRIAELTGGTMNMENFFANNTPAVPPVMTQQAMSFAF